MTDAGDVIEVALPSPACSVDKEVGADDREWVLVLCAPPDGKGAARYMDEYGPVPE